MDDAEDRRVPAAGAIISGSVSASLRRASSASSARLSTNSLSSADTPSRRCDAWAARPGTVGGT